MPQLETEFSIVRMGRAGVWSNALPADHPRQTRYYIRAEDRKAALEVAAARWPNESNFQIVAQREVPVRVFAEAPAKKATKARKAETITHDNGPETARAFAMSMPEMGSCNA